MQTPFDLTPIYRNSIGVDKLMETLQSRINSNSNNYPPFNIISLDQDRYIIEIAIVGFKENEISITAHNGQLTVRGEQNNSREAQHYLHNGICSKKFKRTFSLADYVEVQSADLNEGLLCINLERIVPDSLKPKEIQINSLTTPIEE